MVQSQLEIAFSRVCGQRLKTRQGPRYPLDWLQLTTIIIARAAHAYTRFDRIARCMLPCLKYVPEREWQISGNKRARLMRKTLCCITQQYTSAGDNDAGRRQYCQRMTKPSATHEAQTRLGRTQPDRLTAHGL